MNKRLAIFAAVIAASAMFCQGANAHDDNIKLKVVGIGVGVAATAGYYAIGGWHWDNWNYSSGLTRLGAGVATTIGCAAIAPMVATVVINRPLTMREGHVMVADCVLPIIGGWLVNQAYDAHPDWEPKPMKKHKKKMS